MRSYDVHLLIFVRNVHNAGVVQFAVLLEHGNEDCVFALFLASIFVEFGKEMLVLVLRCSGFHLVFHLKHNGQDFRTVFCRFTIDIVALTAGFCIVIFAKLCARECNHTHFVKLVFAMLLKVFAHHFRGKLRLVVFEICDCLVFHFQLFFVLRNDQTLCLFILVFTRLNS